MIQSVDIVRKVLFLLLFAATLSAKSPIEFGGLYQIDSLGNPYGGLNQGITSPSSLFISAKTQFNDCHWEAFASAIWNFGRALSERYIGNAFGVQQVFGNQNAQLSQLFLKGRFCCDRLSIKLGRLMASNDFLYSQLFFQYVSDTYNGTPIVIEKNVLFTSYPNATWGAVLAVKPTCHTEGKLGIYNANSRILENRFHGLNFTFKSTNGALLITEWAALTGTCLPGKYRIGAYSQTGSSQRFLKGRGTGNWGIYVMGEQTLAKARGQPFGWAPFFNLVFAPSDRNLYPFFASAGLLTPSPITNRPQDYCAFAFAYGRFSADLRTAQRRAQATPQTYEGSIEMAYWWWVNETCALTPDLQIVLRPNGVGFIPDALVLGVQGTVNF